MRSSTRYSADSSAAWSTSPLPLLAGRPRPGSKRSFGPSASSSPRSRVCRPRCGESSPQAHRRGPSQTVHRTLVGAQRAGAVRADVTPDDVAAAVWALRGVIHSERNDPAHHGAELWRRHLETILRGFGDGSHGASPQPFDPHRPGNATHESISKNPISKNPIAENPIAENGVAMPRGSGIYEDEPREHRKTYSQESSDDSDGRREDSAPDDTSSDDAGEPTG